jgi:hypothetical protein
LNSLGAELDGIFEPGDPAWVPPKVATALERKRRAGIRWPGPDQKEAERQFQRVEELRAAGETKSRLFSEIIAAYSSFRDGWMFRRSMAWWCNCSLSTVGRALAFAERMGLLGRARAKKGEIPAGQKQPFWCGFSHRWTIGRGLSDALAQAEIAAARLKSLVKQAFNRPKAKPKAPKPPKDREPPTVTRERVEMPAGLTLAERAAWLDAELAKASR